MTIEIRRATLADCEVITEIHQKSFADGWSLAEFKKFLSQDNVRAYVAGEVGFLLIRIAADEAEIITIATLPEFRRQSIAKELLLTASKELVRQNITTLYLEVNENNQPAIALYDSLGFEQTAIRKNYYKTLGGRENALLFRRKLHSNLLALL